MDRFQTIIQELSKELATPLNPTGSSTCAIQFKGSLFTQIELSENQEMLIIVCVVDKLPPGKYREQVLTNALQENALQSPLIGTFAFSRRSDELLLFANTPTVELTGPKLFEILLVLVDKAHSWQEAIRHNQPMPVDNG